MGDKTIPDSAEPRLESFYPPFVAGIDLPHQGVVDSYNLNYGGVPVILTYPIGETDAVQNSSTPADPYEAKTQRQSRVHTIYAIINLLYCQNYAFAMLLQSN